MIYCGKCKKPLANTNIGWSECPKCKFEVYEVSSW